MSVQNIPPVKIYPCDGKQVNFPFRYKIFEPANLVVYLLDKKTGEKKYLKYITDYSVTPAMNNGYDSGGTVITLQKYESNYVIVIVRSLALEQALKYYFNQPFPPEAIEGALDKLIMLLQEGQYKNDKALVFPPSDPEGIKNELPPLEARKENLLGFDEKGNPVVAKLNPFKYRGDYITKTKYNANDLVRDPISSNVYLVVFDYEAETIDEDLRHGYIRLFIQAGTNNAKYLDSVLADIIKGDTGTILCLENISGTKTIVPKKVLQITFDEMSDDDEINTLKFCKNFIANLKNKILNK